MKPSSLFESVYIQQYYQVFIHVGCQTLQSKQYIEDCMACNVKVEVFYRWIFWLCLSIIFVSSLIFPKHFTRFGWNSIKQIIYNMFYSLKDTSVGAVGVVL